MRNILNLNWEINSFSKFLYSVCIIFWSPFFGVHNAYWTEYLKHSLSLFFTLMHTCFSLIHSGSSIYNFPLNDIICICLYWFLNSLLSSMSSLSLYSLIYRIKIHHILIWINLFVHSNKFQGYRFHALNELSSLLI